MKAPMKDQLKDWKKDQRIMRQARKNRHHAKKKRKKEEALSDRDLKDLMGSNMKTLRRGRGGAYK